MIRSSVASSNITANRSLERKVEVLPIITLLLIVQLLFGGVTISFTTKVANRCVGEASFSVEACACTVKNRLEAGWSKNRVLEHYFAADGVASWKQIVVVDDVLNGRSPCNKNYYYMFSDSDRRVLGLGANHLAGMVTDGEKTIWLYDKWTLGND